MAMFTFDCPHCTARKTTFDITGSVEYGRSHCGMDRRSAAAFCRRCLKSIGIIAQKNSNSFKFYVDFGELLHSNRSIDGFFDIIDYWPHPDIKDAPDYVSPNVSRAFRQAEANKAQKHWDAAGTMYRKVLETATKELGSDLKKEGNLMRRIDMLEEQGRLTKDLAQWAHKVRLMGNETAHEEDEPTAQDVLDLANLTRMLLIYLFELPGRVAAMREQGGHPKELPNAAVSSVQDAGAGKNGGALSGAAAPLAPDGQ